MQNTSKAALRAFLVAIGLMFFVVLCVKSAQSMPNPKAISGRPYIFPTHPLASIAALANTTSVPAVGRSPALPTVSTPSAAASASPAAHTTPTPAASRKDLADTSPAQHTAATLPAALPEPAYHRPAASSLPSVPEPQPSTPVHDGTAAMQSFSRLLF